MNRAEAYSRIIERICLPENREKYIAISMLRCLSTKDELIIMHLKHIRDYLQLLPSKNDELIATSCDSALREVSKLLDEQGWK